MLIPPSMVSMPSVLQPMLRFADGLGGEQARELTVERTAQGVARLTVESPVAKAVYEEFGAEGPPFRVIADCSDLRPSMLPSPLAGEMMTVSAPLDLADEDGLINSGSVTITLVGPRLTRVHLEALPQDEVAEEEPSLTSPLAPASLELVRLKRAMTLIDAVLQRWWVQNGSVEVASLAGNRIVVSALLEARNGKITVVVKGAS